MPFGPQAHCEVDKRAVNQGTRYKREVGQGEEGGKLIKNGYNTTELILSIGEQTKGGLSALLPPKLTGSRQQRSSLGPLSRIH